MMMLLSMMLILMVVVDNDDDADANEDRVHTATSLVDHDMQAFPTKPSAVQHSTKHTSSTTKINSTLPVSLSPLLSSLLLLRVNWSVRLQNHPVLRYSVSWIVICRLPPAPAK